MGTKIYDIAIIGGGIVGTSTAMYLQRKGKFSVIVLEAEESLASHQTGNNSGVIHSGLYYKPGSLKAKNCVLGRELMYRFCEENNIEHKRCGKLVVATKVQELPALNELEKRGIANGIKGLKRLKAEELKEYEPYVNGIEGIHVPETGIVDYTQVTETYAKITLEFGGEIKTNCRFLSLAKEGSSFILETSNGEVKTKFVVNCGGLQSDRIAKLCGVKPNLQIIPFRGEYYKIKEGKKYLVKNLIYPVPDPRFPFLGVHFTRMVNGEVEAGPNAVLAFKREGYSYKDFSLKDMAQLFSYSGFWKMAAKYYMMEIGEFYRSINKKVFLRSLQNLVPEIGLYDIYPAGSGVRAQALDKDGKLVDDFRIVEASKMIHILNAPSPAATASLSIGREISEMVEKRIM
jgi:L-2-hydroxyglutarate oxidase